MLAAMPLDFCKGDNRLYHDLSFIGVVRKVGLQSQIVVLRPNISRQHLTTLTDDVAIASIGIKVSTHVAPMGAEPNLLAGMGLLLSMVARELSRDS